VNRQYRWPWQFLHAERPRRAPHSDGSALRNELTPLALTKLFCILSVLEASVRT